MNKENKRNDFTGYVSPETDIYSISAEGVLCSSTEHEAFTLNESNNFNWI